MTKDYLAGELYKLGVFLREREDGIRMQTVSVYAHVCQLLEGRQHLQGAPRLLEIYQRFHEGGEIDLNGARAAAKEALDARNAELSPEERVEIDD